MTSIEDRENITLADSKSTMNDAVRVTSTELLTTDEDLQNITTVLATKILGIIEQYGLNYERTGKWEGFETFLPIVVGQVSRGESIKMLLPGFPFKSPNTRDKVLDVLPDLGEELALKHVNGLCENIKAVYEHGAEMHITSDGLVYNGECDRTANLHPLTPARSARCCR
jgi:pyoverdine/dityrosine biosynthesis protein Dit1